MVGSQNNNVGKNNLKLFLQKEKEKKKKKNR